MPFGSHDFQGILLIVISYWDLFKINVTHNPLKSIQKRSTFEKNAMSEVILFYYMHRDSGNWKKFGRKKFSNPEQLSIEEITHQFEERLIDRAYFYPELVGIKKFKFHRSMDDYSWYEFEYVEAFESPDPPKKELESISSFILKIKK